MPAKKKKFNARFPPARIKKIMQSDDDVGKVSQVVPVVISKALEIFVESLLLKASSVTRSRNARTLTPSHIKSSIMSDPTFEFLRDFAHSIPDVSVSTDADDEPQSSIPSNSVQKIQRRPSQSKPLPGQTRHAKRGRPRKNPIQPKVLLNEHDTDDDAEDNDDDDDEDDDDDDEDNEERQSINSAHASGHSKRIIEEDDDYDN